MADLRRRTRPSRRLAAAVAVIALAAGSLPAQPPAGRAPQPMLTVRGTVVDEHGKPVAGATVAGGAVTAYDRGAHGGPIKEQTTDEQGAFTVQAFGGAGTAVSLRARRGDAVTEKLVVLRGEALGKPVTLAVSPAHARSLAVRVLDDDSRPVAGAAVAAKFQPESPEPLGQAFMRPVDVPDTKGWVTDPEGRFRSPRRLERGGRYQLDIRAAGFLAAQTAWKDLEADDPTSFGDVVLKRLRPIEGLVRDRQGRPVAGAKVVRTDARQATEVATDADGRFRLEAAAVAPGYLFVEKAGYRFHGRRCDSAEPQTVVLTRRDEPAEPPPLATLPPALPRAERVALAGRLLEPIFARVLDKGSDDDRMRPLEMLARLDPARVLAELEKRPYKNAWFDSYLRRAVAKALLRESAEEARSVVDSMPDPGFRSRGYLDLYDALPPEKKAGQVDLLNQALLHAQGVQANDHRILNVAEVARRLWALGERERATKLLRDGQAVAKELPTAAWSGYARGAFAEDLALIDLPGALELMRDLKDPMAFTRHHGNLAHKIAGTQPAEAQRVFDGMVKPGDRQGQYRRDQYAARVCYRMAPVDLPRARAIAEATSQPHDKARAFGAMALAMAKSKPDEALRLLDTAFEVLAQYAATGKDRFNNIYHGAAVAGVMVLVAEQIDPGLVREFLWRTVALRPRTATKPDDPRGNMEGASIGSVALVVVRFDHALALALVDEAMRQPRVQSSGRDNALLAMAVADPKRAVALVEALPDGAEKDRARESVGSMLLNDGEAVWRAIHRVLGQWHVDDEDL